MTDKSAFDALIQAASTMWEIENFESESSPSNTSVSSYSSWNGDADMESNENTEPNSIPCPKYWMQPDWIPTDGSGNQLSPEKVRKQLLEFIGNSHLTKTTIINAMGVNSNSLRKFIRNRYKDPWRAIENGAYWAAARMMEAHRNERNPPMEKFTYYCKPNAALMSGKAQGISLSRKVDSFNKENCETPTTLVLSPVTHNRASTFAKGRRSLEAAGNFEEYIQRIMNVNVSPRDIQDFGANDVSEMVRTCALIG